MITKLPKDEVIGIGARNRAAYLLEQAGYTLGLAKLDGEDLAALMPDKFLDQVAAVQKAVAAAYREKVNAAEEAKSSTQYQNEVLRQAKLWRRAAVNRSLRAKRAGENVPAALLKIEKGQTVPETTTQITAMVKLLEANAASLHGANVDKLVSDGRELVDELRAVDAAQELKHYKTMPDTVRDFYYQKGLLFIGLKMINDAGHELHADDTTASARYNLSILYRNTRRKKKGDDDKVNA